MSATVQYVMERYGKSWTTVPGKTPCCDREVRLNGFPGEEDRVCKGCGTPWIVRKEIECPGNWILTWKDPAGVKL
jgi:hypothetical protein